MKPSSREAALRSTRATAKPRRTQVERSADTRRRLIAGTIEVVCAHGYASTTTTEISDRAGVSRGALQHQFGTRYDLLVAVCDRLTADMLALHRDLETQGLRLEERVDAVLRRYLSVYASDTFLAVLNIYLGTKTDRQLHARLRRHLAGIDRSSEAPWLALFSDTDVSTADLGALRRIAMATLRGLAVARLLGIIRGSLDIELDLVRSMLLGRLAVARRR